MLAEDREFGEFSERDLYSPFTLPSIRGDLYIRLPSSSSTRDRIVYE